MVGQAPVVKSAGQDRLISAFVQFERNYFSEVSLVCGWTLSTYAMQEQIKLLSLAFFQCGLTVQRRIGKCAVVVLIFFIESLTGFACVNSTFSKTKILLIGPVFGFRKTC